MNALTRREFGQFAVPVTGSIALGAFCYTRSRPGTKSLPRIGATEADPGDAAWRILNRGSFGPAPGDLDRVRAMGVSAYVEEQLAPESIDEDPTLLAALNRLETLGLEAAEARDYELAGREDDIVAPTLRTLLQLPKLEHDEWAASTELRRATLLRATYSRRQLYEVMVEFWTDHFSIDQCKADCAWLKTVDDRQIRKHALGKFRDLLAASAHSSAMLVYLDNTLNVWTPGATGPGNENYARELLELHTLGVDGGYTLRDVQEVARCFTGWGVKSGLGMWPGEFVFNERAHDPGPKTVLGSTIAGGLGERDGEEVIDRLARHPGTAAFIARKLCRRFVSDNPPSQLVKDVAGVFHRTGGDIRQTLACLLQSPEFFNADAKKLKRPFHLVVSALRGVAAETNGEGPLTHLARMAQLPFNHPLPDGYPDTVAPWKGGVLGRWNFAIDLATNGLSGTRINVPALVEATGESDPRAVCRALSRALLGQSLADSQLDQLVRFGDGVDVVEAAPRWLALIMASPGFQWR